MTVSEGCDNVMGACKIEVDLPADTLRGQRPVAHGRLSCRRCDRSTGTFARMIRRGRICTCIHRACGGHYRPSDHSEECRARQPTQSSKLCSPTRGEALFRVRVELTDSCDCSDALLKLGVVNGGFVSGPTMWSPQRQDGPTKIIGKAYTVQYALNDDPRPKVASHYVGRSPR